MKRFFVVCAALVALSAGASAAELANLTVKIVGIGGNGGTMRVAAYDQKGFPPGSPPLASVIVPARPGEMTVTLEGVPAGVICVKVLHDMNGNGKMDFNYGFIPAEPYGFSNNPAINMGPPSWDDVKFSVAPGGNTITIQLKR